MHCPKCQFKNQEGLKFCVECGMKLELTCSKCGFSNASSFKFCGQCGHTITTPSEPLPIDLPFDQIIEKIQKYLPKGLTEKILSQRDRIEGERKQVTVMFCDMEDFSHLSEKLGPEDAYIIMDKVYEILIHKVHAYEGTVNEMTGDGIMALFGAPITLEDAPQRAIRSSLSIHREMTKLSDEFMQDRKDIPPLKMRIGINTGPVVVGALGNDLRVEFKAVGDTVNLASRMEGLADSGTTCVTDETFRSTEGLFRFEALGLRRVKGKQRPVRAYRVIAPSSRRTRFDVSAERGLTPFVGRGVELELLLDGYKRAKAGHGQAFSIMGEAGVGKTRLLYEFRKAVSNENTTFLEGKCLSYSKRVVYHPIIDIMKSYFNLREVDKDNQVKKKVIRGLKRIGVDAASNLPYLLELLSVKDSGIDKIDLSTEAKKDRIIEALKRIVLKGAKVRPLIMAIEDLHWIDKSSEESLKDLFSIVTGAKIFLIFTFRPEFVYPLSGRSYHNQVNLNRLSNRETLAMTAHLLGAVNINRDLEDLILKKTEGVPFFVEEFIRSFKDLNIFEIKNDYYYLSKGFQAVNIPSTIQDVIMARVDSLPEKVKDVIQTGSVIEREFSYELIQKVTNLQNQELLDYISILKDSELVYERGILPESTYVFKHSLTRDVIYKSILTKRRNKLHGKIANCIEKIYQANPEKHYGILAGHFLSSGNYEKGAEYCRLAVRKIVKTASFADAIAYGNKRIFCLERLPKNKKVEKKIIDARTGLGLYNISMGYLNEAKEAVEPIVDLALEHNYKRKVSQIYTIIGSYCTTMEEDYPKAFKYLEDALEIAEELNDLLSLWMTNYWLGLAFLFQCNFNKVHYHWNKALEINMAVNSLWGISAVKSMIGAWIYGWQGKIGLAYQTTEEAIQTAEESGDIFSKAYAYGSHGFSCYCKGYLKRAEDFLLKSDEFFDKIKYFALGSMIQRHLGDTYFDMAKYQNAQECYSKAITLSEPARWLPSLTKLYKIALARAKVMNNEKDIDLITLYKYENENKVKFNDGLMPSHLAGIVMEIGNHPISEAEEWIQKAIKGDHQNRMIWQLGRDYALYSKLCKRKGDYTKAKESLAKAIDILAECEADGWVEKYKKDLAQL